MYICLCHGITDRDVRQALKSGARCSKTVFEALGCQPECGRCGAEVKTMARSGVTSASDARR